MDQDLSGRVSKKIAGLRIHSGRFQQSLEVGPGRHEVRMRVRWDDNTKEQRAAATFRDGVTRRLSVKLGRLARTCRWSGAERNRAFAVPSP